LGMDESTRQELERKQFAFEEENEDIVGWD
jgi:hypothetical protein